MGAVLDQPHQYTPGAVPGRCVACGQAAGDAVHEEPMGEHPEVPRRSGVAAVLGAADEMVDKLRRYEDCISNLRIWCHGKHTVGAVEITNIIASHGL